MDICIHCGSASHDRDGICAGCGYRWQAATTLATKPDSENASLSPIQTKLAESLLQLDQEDLRPKSFKVALLLVILTGPFGLYYCTKIGAIVMPITGFALQFYLGWPSIFLIYPLCILWAWWATRE